MHKRGSDEQLARAAGGGDARAFGALYERHHRQLLSFSRHMVGNVHDAEDVVQHTFVAADAAFRAGRVPKAVRAWLYTVARNRCVSLLRARREDHELPGAGVPSTENLAAEVEQRADLRDLLADLRTLPDDQRAALLLSELGELSHAEVATVIGVRTGKVKALVFQARRRLIDAADARETPCHAIREELAVATGSALRRRHLRNHLARCEECSEFSARVRAQRASIAAILPVVPTVALREVVLGALGSGGGAAAGAGLSAMAGGTTAKLLAIAAVGGAAVGGGTAAVTRHDAPPPRSEAKHAAPAATAPDATAPAEAVPVSSDAARVAITVGNRERPTARERRADARPKPKRRETTPAAPGGSAERAAPGERSEPAAAPPSTRSQPPAQAKQQARDRPEPPGQLRRQQSGKLTPPGQAKKQAVPAPKVKPVKPAKPSPAVAEQPVKPEKPLKPDKAAEPEAP